MSKMDPFLMLKDLRVERRQCLHLAKKARFRHMKLIKLEAEAQRASRESFRTLVEAEKLLALCDGACSVMESLIT